MGIPNKNNTEERHKLAEYYVSTARYYHLSSVVWDNGIWEVTSTGEILGELHREKLFWHIPELIEKYITASKEDFHNFEEDFDRDKFNKSEKIIDEGDVDFDNSIISEIVVSEMNF